MNTESPKEECPHCGSSVLFFSDQRCPSCRQYRDRPFVEPEESSSSVTDEWEGAQKTKKDDPWPVILAYAIPGLILTALTWWVFNIVIERYEHLASLVFALWFFLVVPLLIKGRLGCVAALPVLLLALLPLVFVLGIGAALIDNWTERVWYENLWAVTWSLVVSILLLLLTLFICIAAMGMGIHLSEQRSKSYGELMSEHGEALNNDIDRPSVPP